MENHQFLLSNIIFLCEQCCVYTVPISIPIQTPRTNGLFRILWRCWYQLRFPSDCLLICYHLYRSWCGAPEVLILHLKTDIWILCKWSSKQLFINTVYYILNLMILFSELPFVFTTNVRITDQQTCGQIDKLCLEMIAGTSDAMRDQSLGPRDANIRCDRIEVDCSGGMPF